MATRPASRSAWLFISCVLTVGCRANNPEIVGDWEYTATIPKILNSSISLDPSSPDSHLHLSPTESESAVFKLMLQSNHQFVWKPIGWVGKWSYSDGIVKLQPSQDYASLRLLNGFSPSMTGNIPDVQLIYSSANKTLSWTYGSKKFDKKAVQVYKMKS